jgi:hypothetical protein
MSTTKLFFIIDWLSLYQFFLFLYKIILNLKYY